MWFSKIKLGGLSLLGEDSIYGGRIEGLLDSNSQHNESALITDGSKKGLSKKEPLTISLSLILKENISSIKAFNNFVQLNYILNQEINRLKTAGYKLKLTVNFSVYPLTETQTALLFKNLFQNRFTR